MRYELGFFFVPYCYLESFFVTCKLMACSGCNQMTRSQKIGSIITGWKNVIWKSPEIEAEAIRRVEICADCGSNNNTFCKQCGCWIPAKARSMKEGCPINKW